MYNIRTDLAVEAREIYAKQNNNVDSEGVAVEENQVEDVKITKVIINNEVGEKNMGKPMGTYITIDMPEFTHYDGEIMNRVSNVLAEYLSSMVTIEKDTTALVVGLGNWNVTPDALGPKVVSKIMVTRHLKQLIPDSIDEEIRPVCALSPGVLGITGIETGEIVKSVVNKVKPNLIICIDALASRRIERVNRTIQIGDSGISPGSGIGNKRMLISEKTLGVPVIAIGVPTVVDAATIANDSMDLIMDEMIKQATTGGEFYNMLKGIDKNEKGRLIHELLNPYVGDLVVTPKEVDTVIESVSKIISNGINMALQPALNLEEINSFLS